MIDTVTLRNFRAFRDITLSECRRINVIVGENGSGKTALLEGIFLASGGSPEIGLRLRQWRGFDTSVRFQATKKQIENTIWGDLFYANNMEKPAFVEFKGKNRYSRGLTISSRPTIRITPMSQDKPVTSEGYQPIVFRYKTPNGSFNVSPEYTENGIKFPPMPDSNIESTFYASNQPVSLAEIAARFSDLSKKFGLEKFIEVFRRHFPKVLDLSIESTSGLAFIFAHVDGLPSKIPLNNVSSGMSKLAALLLSIHSQPNGVLLIDEIENGFYYEKFPLIWSSIYDFAKEYNSQIFVSTHSGECLLAAATIAEQNEDDFCLLRAENEKGETKIRRVTGRSFVNAMDRSIEVR